MRAPRRKLARLAVLALLLVAAAVIGYRFWRNSVEFESTDDAYVGAHTVDISAEIAGQVDKVLVENNQHVDAGTPLFQLDRRPYELALAKAQADLAQREAELALAERTNTRDQRLVRQGFLSKEGAETAATQARTAGAAVEAARAAVAQAKLDLERTRISAPAQGVIANLSLRPGEAVQPRVPLFSLIGDREYWVDANFKETQLKNVHPGQRATVTLDMYPDHAFHGVVESLSGGAGTAFSLLPPENATGNWVKVTQRVPVRVRIVDPDPRYPLRIGTSAKVEVRVAS
jgi:membrane fusion protein (multidrug efflux system)